MYLGWLQLVIFKLKVPCNIGQNTFTIRLQGGLRNLSVPALWTAHKAF